MVVGGVVFVIAFLGCCGAVRESSCMVLTFSICLILIFLFEIGIGIAGYSKHDHLPDILEEGFNHTLKEYKSNEEAWKIIQTEVSIWWWISHINIYCLNKNNFVFFHISIDVSWNAAVWIKPKIGYRSTLPFRYPAANRNRLINQNAQLNLHSKRAARGSYLISWTNSQWFWLQWALALHWFRLELSNYLSIYVRKT